MKRYLMTGMAAMVFCGVFTSCSRDTDLGGSNPQQSIQETYEQAFITRFGTPVDSLDWGFGDPTIVRTRSENANANEWADPDKDYGGLLVPPKLTPEQVAVVTAYFQSVKDIPYNDPHWTNYFIQQVYKGHSSPKTGTNPAYDEPYSPEAYMALNGTTELYASDYMDHLAAIDEDNNFFDHINNFNHGDCGENHEVLDNGGNANDGPFHSDKIMYMKNSTTKSFGYFNSNGSLYHNEYTGLVSWTTIRDWANDHGLNGNCLADDWNRSFMGFDFEQMIEGQCYASDNEQWDYSTNPATFISSTPKELIIYGDYIINGETQTNYVYQYNDQPVKMLSDQMNRYCGVKRTVTDEQLYTDLYDADNNNAYLGKRLNTDVIDGLLADGYLPIDNKGLREWAIVGGCADGYYSDWIVTLTEANPIDEEEEEEEEEDYEEIRVIAEDLSVDQHTDFDFNDVVFDVRRYTSGAKSGQAEIILQAAGGTLPLYVDGHEVHAAFGVTNTQTMINTRANAKGYVGVDNAKPVTIPITNNTSKTIRELAKDIEVYVMKKVNKEETKCVLTAPEGDVASKIAVGTNFEWCNERQDIDNKYSLPDGTSLFKEYVQGLRGNTWYMELEKK